MDKNIVSDIKNKMDAYYLLQQGEGVEEAEACENYICEKLDALLEEGVYYTGPGGMNGEWEYIGKGDGSYYNFALLEGPDCDELHLVSVDWNELADCIEELDYTDGEGFFLEDC